MILPEDLTHDVTDLADRRLGFHRVDDMWHHVRLACGCLGECLERRLGFIPITLVTNRLESPNLSTFELTQFFGCSRSCVRCTDDGESLVRLRSVAHVQRDERGSANGEKRLRRQRRERTHDSQAEDERCC